MRRQLTISTGRLTIIFRMKKQSGQVLVLLILIMTISLATGLSVIQKSLSDIATASRVEQSSRAFSAAEAGIEKALKGDNRDVNFPDNGSKATVSDQGLRPIVPAANSQQEALEYPLLAKEDVAQVWLADYNSTSDPPGIYYNAPTQDLDVYWGNSTSDQAALGLTLVYYNGTQYTTKKWYLDLPITRTPDNGFEKVTTCSGYTLGTTQYQCKKRISGLPANMMLLRAHLIYNSSSQPFAVQAVGTCGTACSLPPQARIVFSTGTSGETQRRVKIFQENKVVPPYFDYAIFSAGDINK